MNLTRIVLLSMLLLGIPKISYAFAMTGDVKCSVIISKQDYPKMIVETTRWFQGYFTGRNYENRSITKQFIKFENNKLFSYLLNLCKQEPSSSLILTSKKLYEKLYL